MQIKSTSSPLSTTKSLQLVPFPPFTPDYVLFPKLTPRPAGLRTSWLAPSFHDLTAPSPGEHLLNSPSNPPEHRLRSCPKQNQQFSIPSTLQAEPYRAALSSRLGRLPPAQPRGPGGQSLDGRTAHSQKVTPRTRVAWEADVRDPSPLPSRGRSPAAQPGPSGEQ